MITLQWPIILDLCSKKTHDFCDFITFEISIFQNVFRTVHTIAFSKSVDRRPNRRNKVVVFKFLQGSVDEALFDVQLLKNGYCLVSVNR